jgi:hypothetical protein
MKYVYALACVSGILLAGPAIAAAPSVDLRVAAPSNVESVQYRYERTCRRLRRDCMRIDGVGDRADCRRYRRHCTRWWR